MTGMLLVLAAETEATTGGQVVLSPAVEWIVNIGIFVLAFGMLLAIFRLVVGPHLADRSLAVDTLGVLLIGLVALFVLRYDAIGFVDGMLVLSLLSFAGTVALAQYIARPHLRKKASRQQDQAKGGTETSR